MQLHNCHLTFEQKIILMKLKEWLNEKRITATFNVSMNRDRVLIAFKSRIDKEIMTFIDHTIDSDTIKTFSECGFLLINPQQDYLIEMSYLKHAIEHNFWEARPIQETRPYLNQEQWDFLVTLKSAIYGKYLTQKSDTGFYIRPIQDEAGERIISFDGFKPIFANGHRKELAISLKDFLDLETRGYLEEARNHQHYIIGHKVLPAVDDYLAQKDGTQTIATTSAFRLPDSSTQFKCDIFMVMPFRQELNPVYADHITKVAKELGHLIKRGDDTFSHHDIITEIWSLINNARLIIADCTGKNANVFYEMGLAHAIDKPVIIITQDEEDIPFDIRQRRYIKYEYTPRGMTQFEEELKKAIQSILG